MFIVLPLSTDATIDHKPWGTAALIAVNTAIAWWLGFPDFEPHDAFWGPAPEPPFVNRLVLMWDEFNPFQWLSHAFVHVGYGHLIFNMTFLWTFGLVVEGAVGFGPFLAIYGIAAVIPGALFQILVQNKESIGACGASAAVSGLMAIAALWAPKNRIRLFVWILVIIRRPEVSVLGFCTLWLGLDLYFALRGGFALSSGLAHVTGAVVGVGIGIVMLQKKWLDCEGWDYLSIRKHGRPRYRMEALKPVVDIDADLLSDFRTALEEREGYGADRLAGRLSSRCQDWAPSKPELLTLIRLLRKSEPERCVERMREYIERYPGGSASLRIMLAEMLVELGRPSAGLEELNNLPDDQLSDAQRAAKAHVVRRAAKRRGGGLELE